MLASPLELLLRSPLGWVAATVWGGLWGSFFNVAIYRIGAVASDEQAYWDEQPDERPPGHRWVDDERTHLRWIGKALASLTRPARSFCPACKAPVRARHNLPLLGWLLLGGRCHDCRARISPVYPFVEALAMGLAALVYARFVVHAPAPAAVAAGRFFVYFGLCGVLLVLAAIDLRTMLLPDAITWPAIPVFFVAGRLLPDVTLVDAALGVVIGYGGLQLIDWTWRLVTGRNALGGGDAKLLALVGGLLGWRALPWTLFGAAIVGLAVTLPILIVQRLRVGRNSAESKAATATPIGRVAVPFGPYLAAAALLYLFAGRTVEELVFAG